MTSTEFAARREGLSLKKVSLSIRRGVTYFYSIFLILLAWELLARSGQFPPIFLPTVTDVFGQLLKMAESGLLWSESATSIVRALGGFALSIVAGVPIGVAMARLGWLDWLFQPLVGVGFPAPKIAFIPIFVLWFGVGDESKILLTAFTCVFPMIVSSYHGAEAVNPFLVWSARAMGTSERDILRRIVIPASLPYIFNGMRVALPLSLIVVFVSEMVTGGGGLGFVLTNAQRNFDTKIVFAALFAMLIIGYLMDRILLEVRYWVMRWHEEAQHREVAE